MKTVIVVTTVFCLFFTFIASTAGRSLVPAKEYGKVILTDHSTKALFPPARFDHWLHRAFFTCRLCHVDLGFAMQQNGTKVTAEANAHKLYCGSCHNGKTKHFGRPIFESCSSEYSSEEKSRCRRCHYSEEEAERTFTYDTFARRFPKLKTGNLVDWERTEALGFIQPLDALPDSPPRRPPLKAQPDFSITSRGTWIADIIFSHQKHAVWNGCEVCHPEIFPSVKKGATRYSMFQISEGEYCGACHGSVAFPVEECQRCHKAKTSTAPPKGK
ncbi:MAG TPA: c(7)-type cytochrome triheme domain-containing protein [Desulfomonilaceae bacterium]|nr:c(7)-type cytochrome triheme domain-containing protein [Desulfomonilaceae bacterium]